MNSSPVIVSASDLSFATPDRSRTLASGLNFQIGAREILLITGPNGSGKSCLLQVILHNAVPEQGSVNILTDHFFYLPQLMNPQTHMPLTIRDIIWMYLGSSATQSKILATGLLDKEHMPLSWNTASGGERKRTLLTVALLQNPDLIILDEPFHHLDTESFEVVGHALQKFLEHGALVLVVHEKDRINRFQAHIGAEVRLG